MATHKSRLITELQQQNGQIPFLSEKLEQLVSVHEKSKDTRQERINTLKADLKQAKAALSATESKLKEATLAQETTNKQSHELEIALTQCKAEQIAQHTAAQLLISSLNTLYQFQANKYTTSLCTLQAQNHAQALHALKIERKLADREAALRELLSTLEQVEVERDDLRSDLGELQNLHTRSIRSAAEDRSAYRKEITYLAKELAQRQDDLKSRQADLIFFQLESTTFSSLLDLTSSIHHTKFSSLDDALSATTSALHSSQDEVESLSTQLKDCQSSLVASQSQCKDLESTLETTQSDLATTQDDLAIRDEELKEARKEEWEAESKAEEAMEARGRMAGLLAQSRAAEEGLKGELAEAEEELTAARETAIKFIELQQVVGELAARNELAEGDAKHLSELNASLLGHSNAAQKIMNIQKIRAELTEVKKKHLRDQAGMKTLQTENADLKAELQALRAVDQRPAVNLKASTRIKVQRQASADGTENIPLVPSNRTVLPKFGMRKALAGL